jgi:hypothetical protein
MFNYLFSNGDAHLKNFSLLESSKGDYFLSPLYERSLQERIFNNVSCQEKLPARININKRPSKESANKAFATDYIHFTLISFFLDFHLTILPNNPDHPEDFLIDGFFLCDGIF